MARALLEALKLAAPTPFEFSTPAPLPLADSPTAELPATASEPDPLPAPVARSEPAPLPPSAVAAFVRPTAARLAEPLLERTEPNELLDRAENEPEPEELKTLDATEEPVAAITPLFEIFVTVAFVVRPTILADAVPAIARELTTIAAPINAHADVPAADRDQVSDKKPEPSNGENG